MFGLFRYGLADRRYSDLIDCMAISRTKKETVVEALRAAVREAETVVFVRFSGVTVEEADALRTACASEGVGYMVAKKTLIRKAFEDAGVTGELPVLEGEAALAYGSDLLAPARVLGEQGKKLDGRLEIVGGVFEGAFVGQEKMQTIAAIPPIETLYAQFLMVIRSPVQGFASVLGQVAEKK